MGKWNLWTNMENNKKEPTPTKALVHEESVSEEIQLVNDYNIDAFLEKRAEFITKVNKIMVEGKDYHVIQGKKSLAKGGAEKIASIFGWTARFEKDTDVAEAFREVPGLISFVCKLTRGENVVGEGRGAALLAKNSNDPNKTIKMGQKSAFIDAVLRASGLSDFFTQDLEDMPKDQTSKSPKSSYHNLYFCSEHDETIGKVKAGISYKKDPKGIPYPSFYACSVKGCRAPILNSDGVRVRQNPETGEMVPDQIQEAELVQESSVDKARRILDAKIPPNHGQELEFNTK